MFRNLLVGSLKSRTIWLNVGWVALVALELAGHLEVVKSNPDVVAVCIALTNILMRFVTTKPLAEK